MEAVDKSILLKNEMIMGLLELLKQNNMPQEVNHTFELCTYIDSLEKKLDSMTEELTYVKQQLKDMQEDTVLNNLKAQVQAAAERLQERCNMMIEQLFIVKDNIKSKASDIVMEANKKGKVALNKISELLDVKGKLMDIRTHVKESQKDVSTTIAKIDAFGTGIREANQKIANTFRTFADKEVVDYSQSEKKLSKTELVKKPWIAKQKILEAMELRIDAAIDKVENLARDVDIDRMMKKFDSMMEKSHNEQVGAMVAETEYQYGADAFEACAQGMIVSETNTEIENYELKKEGKSR
ncbi:DUF6674 family protein [Lachnotalea glycerini]|uniref:Uncharacterized protein n=1 Tax=Lachnotalea glycerini TaxID=1763509 RepID=A0A371JBT5_9FIRM|nr:DUF6674 family protein [Lachnotalea glycerini]RDY30138.1 hypothetical protein CG710_016280 [Lachnotalea glycerini]